jgi:arginyl-tRNA synthetase
VPALSTFFLNDAFYFDVVKKILEEQQQYGQNNIGKGQTIHLEYVSANPTGPLHVGHGRGAAFGSSIASILQASGYQVHQEYYVNDRGRQMRILALSVWIRYLQIQNIDISLPDQAYAGDYILPIARTLYDQYKHRFTAAYKVYLSATVETNKHDAQCFLDDCVCAAIEALGEKNFDIICNAGRHSILEDIKSDLQTFRVNMDAWFSEKKLLEDGYLQQCIDLLKTHGYAYEKEQALWFKAADFGDEKDRVLIRANGQPTYFASDVAYHLYKYETGCRHIIDILGADHHGYVNRIHGFLKALGKDASKTTILLVQFAILYRGTEKVSMSTRAGQFITLKTLYKEVGIDAARFFYIMRKPEQHLDFDLELAKKRSNENPVYYIQYAHARICSVQEKCIEQDQSWQPKSGIYLLHELTSKDEKDIMKALEYYPTIIKAAAKQYTPHKLAHYLQDLAGLFHSYYNAAHFLVDCETLRQARLCFIEAIRQTLHNGLTLLGITAPSSM